ncbi:MAG TPA: hypothetical protein GX404_00520 [Syntrophomonadaceae bacterium]|nr:hypothetical protein [Syntrophomonadaceae bacterium]
MILYIEDPTQLFAHDEKDKNVYLSLPSGGVVCAEPLSSREYSICSVISTDPRDYMLIQPGDRLEVTLKKITK